MRTRDRALALDKMTAITQWQNKGNADSVLALDNFFDALLYFDEVHIPRAAISDEFAEVCVRLASRFSGPPFDEPKLASKVDEGIYLLGDELILGGYKAAIESFWNDSGSSFDEIVLGNVRDIPDPRERHIVECMVVAQVAVMAGVSGANSCMHPDYLRTEIADAATTESAPIMEISNIQVVDVSQLTLTDVLEIRRDPGFRQSLRRLRYFLTEEYDGLSSAQIEDKFLTHLESHERAVALASDNTVTQSLSCFLGTSFWPSTLLLAATLLGQSLPEIKQLIAAGGVVALSAGRTYLEFRKANLAYLELREDPIDYVYRLREKTP